MNCRSRLRLAAALATALVFAPAALPSIAADWVPLFNGKDLSGWRQIGGGKWTVEDGTIVGATGTGEYGWLVTEREYSNFVLRARWKFERIGNSGIQFRSWLESGEMHGYQADIDPARPRGIGLLWEEKERGLLCPASTETARNVRIKGWNDYEISALGDHIQIYLNGTKSVDIHDTHSLKGIIALQVHSGGNLAVRWKDIRILEVPEGVDWRPAFNGKDLGGWHVQGGGKWYVEDGAVVGETGTDAYGHLILNGTYRDFVFRFRTRFLDKGNSGVYARGRLVGEEMHGMQCEINPLPGGHSGGLYESYGRGWLALPDAEGEAALDPKGWNDYEVSAIGDHFLVHVNGVRTADLRDPQWRSGLIAFQCHSGKGVKLLFKDMRILVLPTARGR